MKRNIIILVVLLGLSTGLFAQNTGYMGNRFLINADIVLSPSYFKPSFMNKNPGYLSFNYIFSPNIEIIAWKKGTVGFVGHQISSRYARNSEYGYGFNGTSYENRGADICDLSAWGYGVFYKQYYRKERAPMGNYIKIEVDFFHYKYNLELVNPEKSFMAGMKVELGKDYLFFNRLRCSLSYSMGFTFQGMENVFTHSSTSPFDAAQGKMAAIYWLGFKFGIGALAF